jgi:hypothetical protein
MTVLTVFRSARSTTAPPKTERVISSSVSSVAWPHFWMAAMTAVPVCVGDFGYSDPGATDSTARGLTNGSDWVTSTAPPEDRNRWVRIWSETNRRSRKSRSRR